MRFPVRPTSIQEIQPIAVMSPQSWSFWRALSDQYRPGCVQNAKSVPGAWVFSRTVSGCYENSKLMPQNGSHPR